MYLVLHLEKHENIPYTQKIRIENFQALVNELYFYGKLCLYSIPQEDEVPGADYRDRFIDQPVPQLQQGPRRPRGAPSLQR